METATMSPARADKYCKVMEFLLRIVDPEDLGHAVTNEVRQEATKLLMPPEPMPVLAELDE